MSKVTETIKREPASSPFFPSDYSQYLEDHGFKECLNLDAFDVFSWIHRHEGSLITFKQNRMILEQYNEPDGDHGGYFSQILQIDIPHSLDRFKHLLAAFSIIPFTLQKTEQ